MQQIIDLFDKLINKLSNIVRCFSIPMTLKYYHIHAYIHTHDFKNKLYTSNSYPTNIVCTIPHKLRILFHFYAFLD